MFYNKQGNKITIEKWCELLTDRNHSIIKQEETKGYLISTVWLGINHGHESKPLIFETLYYNKDNKQHIVRYPTLKEAIDGHEAIKQALMNYK